MFAQRIAAAIQKAVPRGASPAPAQSKGMMPPPEMIKRIVNGAPALSPAPAQSKGTMPPPEMINRIAQGFKGMRFNKGGAVSSGRGDGIAVRGKTKCKMY
jgi:hypothetical protein